MRQFYFVILESTLMYIVHILIRRTGSLIRRPFRLYIHNIKLNIKRNNFTILRNIYYGGVKSINRL